MTWIPIAEQTPPERQVVIVCQTSSNARIFAGWRSTASWSGVDRWWAYLPDSGLTVMGDIRTTDFWLALPEYPS